MRYRKKPVEVEAFHYDSIYKRPRLYEFVTGSNLGGHEDGELFIRTLEGDMKVSVGDYVIKGVNGEFYPCKPDIFAKTYEKVEEESE